MIQQLGYNQAGNVGALAIANSSGNFTYYPDYTTALANAKSGDTIVQFQNIVESRPVSIVLKNGVNINMNGFSYTLLANIAANTEFPAFTDSLVQLGSNIGVTCSIMNGTIIVTPNAALGNNGDKRCLTLNLLVSNITTNCVFNGHVTLPINTAVYSYSCVNTLTGGVVTGVNGGVLIGSGTINNMVGVTLFASSRFSNVYVNNCVFKNTSTTTPAGTLGAIYGQPLIISNTIFISTGYIAVILSQPVGLTTNNCIYLSTANIGVTTTYGGAIGVNNNLTVISTSSYAIGNIPSWPTTHNINTGYIYSSASNAVYNSQGIKFYNCNLVSTAAAVINSNSQNSTLINCIVDCQWNNILGHAINNAQLISNSFINVSNPNAKCLNANTAWNTTYLNNIFQGTTTPVGGNVIQSQTQNTDLYANISIG